jgi:hypothetical protein
MLIDPHKQLKSFLFLFIMEILILRHHKNFDILNFSLRKECTSVSEINRY